MIFERQLNGNQIEFRKSNILLITQKKTKLKDLCSEVDTNSQQYCTFAKEKNLAIWNNNNNNTIKTIFFLFKGFSCSKVFGPFQSYGPVW